MPIFESEAVTRQDLEKMRRQNDCAVCGARLNTYLAGDGRAFIACWDYLRTQHEGIIRPASEYEKHGADALTIEKRREIMTNEYGDKANTALAKLPTSGALTQPQAMTILKLVYPDVPETEIIRTAILCRDFGLHPLMKEVYIIGFKNAKTGKTDYSTVIGIAANRKMAAAKKGAFSFLDDTPRAASKQEVVKQFGENSEEERDNLVSICKLRGEKGNEATGFGLWPKDKAPYGTDKGNTQRNMANIRAERQALDRLPGEALPTREYDVIDEAYAEVPETTRVIAETGEIIEGEATEVEDSPKEHWCEEHNCAFEKKKSRYGTFYAHKIEGGWCNENKKKEQTPKAETHIPESVNVLPSDEPSPEPEPGPTPKGFVDIDWFKESLQTLQATELKAWTDSNLLSYMKTTYKTEAKTVLEAVAGLDKGQSAHFVQRIEETLSML